MSTTTERRDRIYYDGACGLCRRSARWFDRLDWLGRLEAVDMTAVPAEQLPVSYDDALRGMPMRTRDGRSLVGFPAVRRALAQTPLGAIPGALLYLPGVSHAARRVYGWIATNRRRDACEACAIDPGPDAAR